MRRLSIPALLLCAVLGGCHSGSPSALKRLRIQLGTEPISLDPALAEDGASLRVHGNTMEGLVGYDGAGRLVPRLARSWRLSPDRRVYTFELREDARWSDGHEVTAGQFVFGIRRALAPKTGSKLAALLAPIREVRAEGKTLVIELKQTTGYFLQALVLPVSYPAREDLLIDGRWPTVSPGTGPYFVREATPGQKIVLSKNPHYRDPVAIEEVEFDIVPEESTGMNLFDRGELDIVTKVPTFDLPRLSKAGVIRTDPFPATYFIAFNLRHGLFSDRQWRRAVAGSIRKSQITEALATGETPARSWVPVGIEGGEKYVSDAEDQARFSDAVHGIQEMRARAPKAAIAASFDSSARNSLIMEKIQSDLRGALGLRMSLSNLDWKTYIRTMQTDPTPIYRFGWLAPFSDPISHLEAFMSGNPNNSSGFSNARYDTLVRKVAATESGPERLKLIREADRILVEEEA
ncbi:MAG: peptide ABC transporter substrate-binding protein, partial [Bdellovibrionota bacterium]